MSEIREGPSGRTGSAVSEERGFAGVGESSHATRDRRRGRAGRTKFVVLTEKRKPERRDRTAAPRPEATPPAMRHRTATQPFGAKKMQLRQSKCSTYDDVAFTLPIVAFTLSGDPKSQKATATTRLLPWKGYTLPLIHSFIPQPKSYAENQEKSV